MCTEGAGVPGVQRGQQDPPQSGSALADKVVTQPRGTDNDSTRVWNKAFSSSVTPTTFQVLSSVMWPGAMVLDRADVWKVPSSQRILLDIPLQITEGLQREHLPQGGFACVALIHRYLGLLFIFACFHWKKGFENLAPFKLTTGGTMCFGSTKQRAEEHNTMRTPVWTELSNGVKIKLHGALVAH